MDQIRYFGVDNKDNIIIKEHVNKSTLTRLVNNFGNAKFLKTCKIGDSIILLGKNGMALYRKIENFNVEYFEDMRCVLGDISEYIIFDSKCFSNSNLIVCFQNGRVIKINIKLFCRKFNRYPYKICNLSNKSPVVSAIIEDKTEDYLFITEQGRALRVKSSKIPQRKDRRTIGKKIINLKNNDKVVSFLKVSSQNKLEYIILALRNGLFKKYYLKNIRRRGDRGLQLGAILFSKKYNVSVAGGIYCNDKDILSIKIKDNRIYYTIPDGIKNCYKNMGHKILDDCNYVQSINKLFL